MVLQVAPEPVGLIGVRLAVVAADGESHRGCPLRQVRRPGRFRSEPRASLADVRDYRRSPLPCPYEGCR
jgi:hypothetical protein